MEKNMVNTKLDAIITPALEALGLELWGTEILRHGKQTELWVYVEGPEGSNIDIDQCAKASRQISAILDVEDPISGAYQLQVSTPGMDRRFFRPEQYARFIGQKIKVQLRLAIQERKNFVGILTAADDEKLELDCGEGEMVQLQFNQIDKARLVFEI